MIDCGSKAEESDSSWHNVAQLLRSRDVFGLPGAQRNLEALILTHADRDHISKVPELLAAELMAFSYEIKASDSDAVGTKRRRQTEGFEPIYVSKVYFSDPTRRREDFKASPLRSYAINKCHRAIYNHLKVQELYCVTLNNEEMKIDKWTKPSNEAITGARKPFSERDYSEQTITRSGLLVCDGRTDDGKVWSITIIAGNVRKAPNEIDTSDQEGKNAGSLVTLIKFGVEKFLICGDATVSTEQYLIQNYPNPADLQNLSLIQVGHHGSNTSFSSAFIDGSTYIVNGENKTFGGAKAKRAVISVQLLEHSHHLPAFNAIGRAQAHAQAYDSHRIHYWEELTTEEFYRLKGEWEAGMVVFETKYDREGRDARYVRTDRPADFEGIIVLDGLNSPESSKKHALYQKLSSKELQLTGIEGHIWYYFDGTGT